MTAVAVNRHSDEKSSFSAARFIGRYGALLVLLAIVVIFAALQPDTFATQSNLINILNQSALTAVIAMGLTFPLLCGEFDLSIGYSASLAGVIACTLMTSHGWSIPAALIGAVIVGIFIGLLNGLIVTKIGVNALIATLGVGTVLVGINYAIAGGTPVPSPDPAAFVNLTLGKFFGIPYPVYVMAVMAIALWLLLNKTTLGHGMQAVGGNPVAAHLSGVRVDRVRVVAFVIAGGCAALTGVLLAARTGSATVDGGDGYLLPAYAAAFFGSAVLREGQFHVVGTLLGVLTISVGFNGIAITGAPTYFQYLFQGCLLILAVGAGTLARRKSTA